MIAAPKASRRCCEIASSPESPMPVLAPYSCALTLFRSSTARARASTMRASRVTTTPRTAPSSRRTSTASELRPSRAFPCVVITGESGAGKTSAAKQLMNFVTMVGTATEPQAAVMRDVTAQLLESNPILESFGNAQTVRNDNSSRFGKLMQMDFSFKGSIAGGSVTTYLLEKSRVTTQAVGERSYHAFHYLLAGATPEERSRYGLLPA
ncbi:unnamed protein product, partial [Phaeothamnion confervicola]